MGYCCASGCLWRCNYSCFYWGNSRSFFFVTLYTINFKVKKKTEWKDKKKLIKILQKENITKICILKYFYSKQKPSTCLFDYAFETSLFSRSKQNKKCWHKSVFFFLLLYKSEIHFVTTNRLICIRCISMLHWIFL